MWSKSVGKIRPNRIQIRDTRRHIETTFNVLFLFDEKNVIPARPVRVQKFRNGAIEMLNSVIVVLTAFTVFHMKT